VPTVHIDRLANPYGDRLRKYRVLLDEREVATLLWGGTVEIPVTAGAHRLRLKIDWAGSRAVDFEVAEGEVVDFQCRPRRSAGLAFVSLVQSIFQRDQWLVLERV